MQVLSKTINERTNERKSVSNVLKFFSTGSLVIMMMIIEQAVVDVR